MSELFLRLDYYRVNQMFLRAKNWQELKGIILLLLFFYINLLFDDYFDDNVHNLPDGRFESVIEIWKWFDHVRSGP